MQLSLTVPPTGSILAWDGELSTHLRVDADDERQRVEGIVLPAAVEWIESHTNRALLTQTWTLTMDFFPGYGYSAYFLDVNYSSNASFGTAWFAAFGQGVIPIPRPLCQSVVSVTYVDTNGVVQTWDPLNYVVSRPLGPKGMYARLYPAFGQQWPLTRPQRDAVVVTFIAGYGDDASSVPAAIKQAALMIVGEAFERREDGNEISISRVPIGALSYLAGYLVEV